MDNDDGLGGNIGGYVKKLNKWKPVKKVKAKTLVSDDPLEHDFEDIAHAKIIPPKWVIQDLVPVGMCVLQGPPKEAYKSTLTVIEAILCARWECEALPPWAYCTAGGPTLMWAYEAQAGEIKWVIKKGLEVQIDDRTIWRCRKPYDYKLDGNGVQRFLAHCRAHKPRLVVLDPFRNMWSGDENDSAAVMGALAPVRDWCHEEDAAAVLVHHTKKPGETVLMSSMHAGRGSSALPGMADGILTIEPGGRQGRIVINGVFKRGESYRRTVDLGIPGFGWGRRGREVLTEMAIKVRDKLRDGDSIADIAAALKLDAHRANEVMQMLERNNLIPEA